MSVETETVSNNLQDMRIPRLVRGVRLREDTVRGGWILLAPEKVYKLDTSGREIMQLVDGFHSIESIVTLLAEKFDADQAIIHTDVTTYLTGLAERQVIEFV